MGRYRIVTALLVSAIFFCFGRGASQYIRCSNGRIGGDIYECKAPPPATVPCSTEGQQAWVVEDSAQAEALAAATNCSGGFFEVEWRGRVVLNRTIYIANGTTVNITGADSSAVIDGNRSSRLFTVVNASLDLEGVSIISGASLVGGAIAAAGSSLMLTQTHFSRNNAALYGGAVYVSVGSNVSCVEVRFVDNTAGRHGGAMYVSDRSAVSCSGEGTYRNNVAGWKGGAIRVLDGSSVSWVEEVVFANNKALEYGGALNVKNGSSVFWSPAVDFDSNNAVAGGGALIIDGSSSASWTSITRYTNNSGGFGGALLVLDSTVEWGGVVSFTRNVTSTSGGALFVHTSSVSWNESTTNIFSGNSALSGGALYVSSYSDVLFRRNATFDGDSALGDPPSYGYGGAIAIYDSIAEWRGQVKFNGNAASFAAGALFAQDANISWQEEAEFCNNSALYVGGAYGAGGALFLFRATVEWRGLTVFTGNTASLVGGALFAQEASSVSWGGETSFCNNSANEHGGALAARSSRILWTGDTLFADNSAELETASYGGAIALSYNSSVSWGGGTTRFVRNVAGGAGGALYLLNNSNVSWSGDTEFDGCVAAVGGAIFVADGSSVRWSGQAEFTSNEALWDGGAVSSPPPEAEENHAESSIAIMGKTAFINNTCGANGGALAMFGALSLTIDTEDVSFVGNSANAAGGAVIVSGTGVGPVFSDVNFISNSAQVGGGVYVVGSGNTKDALTIEAPNPTQYHRCRFVNNRATATGGAIDSAAGQDSIVASIFINNTSGVGGALRLAGTANINNCTFVDTVSDEGGGAAVSNIGSILTMTNNTYIRNVFGRQRGEFLGFNASGDLYGAVCDGCSTECTGCIFDHPRMAPMCEDVMDHATSSGSTETLDMISIEPGYWRATPFSTEIIACYHAEACFGGVTGTLEYCLEGNEGPYCATCGDGYTGRMGSTCSKCPDTVGGIVLVAIGVVAALLIAAAFVAYLTSADDMGWAGGGAVEGLQRCVPLQYVKIVIVTWQILTQFTSVANVVYPDIYQQFLRGLDIVNFDFTWAISASCIFDLDFHDRLLIATIGPIMTTIFLAATYAVAVLKHRGATEALRVVRHKHVSMVLLLTFFVYSSVSSVLFETFACDALDDGKTYLRADYRIECDTSKHKAYQMYAGFMLMVFPVGIPGLYTGLLVRDRYRLKMDGVEREESIRVSSTSDLWSPYKPSVFYYEVIECGRRILLAGVVVFIYPNTAAQIAITLKMAFAFTIISEGLAPYACKRETWLTRMGHVVVFASMYLALLLKVDVSDERVSSQKVFEAILVAAHACMVVVVVVETVVLAWSLRADQGADPVHMFRCCKLFRRRRGEVKVGPNPAP